MKRLIINADDYGRTPEISRGIREAHVRGVVTSTTCMMNIPTTAEDIDIVLKETPALGMGVHLVLTMGSPISAPETVPSITDKNGHFFKYTLFVEQLLNLNLKIDEIKKEWRAQIEAFVRAAGRRPTHLDSHHHCSYLSPELFHGMLTLAKEYDCAIRFPFMGNISRELEETDKHVPELIKKFNPPRPDRFVMNFYDERATAEELMDIVNSLPDGSTEIMCHPGYVNDDFVKESAYNVQRERELKILTDPGIQEAMQARGVERITFAQL